MCNLFNKYYLAIIIFITIFLFPFVIISAQSNTDDVTPDLYNMTLEELLNVKISIASRRVEKRSDAPSSVTVFTHNELREMGITHLEELFNYVPGMQSVRRVFDTRFDSVAVRGVGHTWGDGVQVMINGLRQQDSYSGGSALFNRMLSLDNVERVEIIRGPGSSMYGANAFLGAINVITSDKQNSFYLSKGSFDSNTVALNFSQQSDDREFSLFAKTFSDDGDSYDNLHDRFGRTSSSTDPIDGHDLSVYLKTSDFKIRARYMERDSHNFYNWGLLSNSIARNYSDYFQLSLDYKLPLPERWQGAISISKTNTNWRGTGAFVTQGNAPFISDDFIAGPIMLHKDKTFTGNLGYDFSNKHQVNFGFQYENMSIPKAGHHSNYDFLSGLEVYLGEVVDQFDDNIRFVSDRERIVSGTYLQDQYHWTENLTTTFGLRYDHFNDFNSSTNPRFAMNYQFDNNHKFKIMFGEAFRAPSINNLDTQNNPSIVGNSDLIPETVQTFEMAYLYSNNNLETTVTLFQNQIDEIITQTATSEGLVQYENAGRNDTTGLEFEMIYIVSEQFHLRANYSNLFSNKTQLNKESSIDKGEHFLPKELLSFSITYKQGKYTANLSGFVRGKIDELPNENSVAVINSNIQYHINDQSSLFFTAKNLFDEQYYDAATGSGLGIDLNGDIIRSIPNRGRQVAIGYRYDLN